MVTLRTVDRARALATSRLFRGMDEAWVESLRLRPSRHRLEPGEPLWLEGQPATHFYIVQRGVLELTRIVPSGESTVLAFLGPGESAEVPAALERGRYVSTSNAVSGQLDVLSVNVEPILSALPGDPALGQAMTRALLAHCELLQAKTDVLAAGSVPRRLATLMLDLADRFGDEMESGETFIPLPLTRGQIASFVSARVETVIRCCTGWERAGMMKRTPAGFSVPCIGVLRAVASGDDSPLDHCRLTCPSLTAPASERRRAPDRGLINVMGRPREVSK